MTNGPLNGPFAKHWYADLEAQTHLPSQEERGSGSKVNFFHGLGFEAQQTLCCKLGFVPVYIK